MTDHIITGPRPRQWRVNLTKLENAIDAALIEEERRGWTTPDGGEVTVKVQDLVTLMEIAGWKGF